MATEFTPAPAAPPPKLRWYQYRLRSLFVLMLLATIPLGWLRVKMNAAEKQHAAVEAIKQFGGTVGFDYEMDPSNIKSKPPGPAWLHKLLGEDVFASVTLVSFSGFEVGRHAEIALKHLKAFPRLKCLQFDQCYNLGDDGLENLRGLTELQFLNLGCPQVSDVGLENIKGLTQLQYLDLLHANITDAGLRHIEGLVHLQMLYLAATNIGDAGLEHLTGLTQLEELDVDSPRITDAGLENLAKLTKLRKLNLQRTDVSDAGLKHLKGLTGLQMLLLDHTKVSAAGVADLQKALPKTRIYR